MYGGTTLYRQWCQKCQNWQLFERKVIEGTEGENKEYEHLCRSCGTPHEPTRLGDIPKEKLEEQRERYNAQRRGQFTTLMNEFRMGPEERRVKELFEMFGPVATDTQIIEGDAGQKAIEELQAAKRAKAIEEKQARKQEIINECVPYKNMSRNDQCACGSGKKYKKCCMDKIEGYLLEYNLSFKSYK